MILTPLQKLPKNWGDWGKLIGAKGLKSFIKSTIYPNLVTLAAIAQWICLQLPSCHPGLESQAHQLRFYQFIFELCHVEKTKINKKGRDLKNNSRR